MKIHTKTVILILAVIAFMIVTLINSVHSLDVFGYHLTAFLPAISVLLIGAMLVLHEHRHHKNKPPNKP